MVPLSFRKSEKGTSSSPSAPDTTATPQSSKYHPSRLLRRRPSRKGNLTLAPESDTTSSSTSTSKTSPPTGSTASSFVEVLGGRGSEPALTPWGGGGGENVVVVDGGISPRGIADPAMLFPTSSTPSPRRPLTPPFNAGPVYPTALSPPRRPMPRSPRAHCSPGETSSMMDTLSATRRASSPIVPVPDPPSPARPIVSSEWLRRKPSSSGRPRNPSGARKLLDGASRIRSASFTDRESSSADSDGEIGVGVPPSRRRSKIGDGAYDVKILCLDRREEGDEMKWEVSIRRRRLRDGEVNGAPSSPLQLSTNSSIVQAPSSASSINLSLSLDQPTGKLVFIAFPMDLHATPTRRKAKEKEKEDEKEKEKQKERDSPQPRPSTPPPAPNLANSPTTPSSRKKGATSMWPSPSKNGVGRSRSPASPRDMFTPRRTRIVSAAQLDGGLYARGTVDGMSEELENELRINGDRK